MQVNRVWRHLKFFKLYTVYCEYCIINIMGIALQQTLTTSARQESMTSWPASTILFGLDKSRKVIPHRVLQKLMLHTQKLCGRIGVWYGLYTKKTRVPITPNCSMTELCMQFAVQPCTVHNHWALRGKQLPPLGPRSLACQFQVLFSRWPRHSQDLGRGGLFSMKDSSLIVHYISTTIIASGQWGNENSPLSSTSPCETWFSSIRSNKTTINCDPTMLSSQVSKTVKNA